MTRSEIHPTAVVDHDVPAPHATLDVRAPQPDLGGAPPVADLLRDGLDGLLRDLRPTNPTGGGSAQHAEPQQNSRRADEARDNSDQHDHSTRQDNSANRNDAAQDNHTQSGSQDRQSTERHSNTGTEAHRTDATVGRDGGIDAHNAPGAGASVEAGSGHQNAQAGASASFGTTGR